MNLNDIIKINREEDTPLYLQMSYQIINAIQLNKLALGARLPGTRRIAVDLGVHRKTVVACMEELQAQAWIEVRPFVGSFVRRPESSFNQFKSQAFKAPKLASFNYKSNYILDKEAVSQQYELVLNDGLPDYKLIPLTDLIRFYTAVSQRKQVKTNFEREHFLKEQISQYVNFTQSFQVRPAHVLATNTRQQIYSIIAQMLISSQHQIAVGDLSWYRVNMLFNQYGAKIKTLPVDEEGLRVDLIPSYFKPKELKLVYLNSRAYYPTSVPLSKERRKLLLEFAEVYDFVIIEDDIYAEYESQNSFKSSLFYENNGERVLYLGLLGSFLAPGFQTHYLLGAVDFIEEAHKYLGLFGEPNALLSQAIGEIIKEGDMHRYRRKAKQVQATKKQYFIKKLQESFGSDISYQSAESDIAVWISFKKYFSLLEWRELLLEDGMFIPRICLYQQKNICALRLGYVNLSLEEIDYLVPKLYRAYSILLNLEEKTVVN